MDWKPLDHLRWIGVDFDGTLAGNSGFPHYLPGGPLPGAVEAMQKIDAQGYQIVIFTARAWSEYHNIVAWCKEYNVPVRRIVCGKPLFLYMIDDKNIEFHGDWNHVLDKLSV